MHQNDIHNQINSLNHTIIFQQTWMLHGSPLLYNLSGETSLQKSILSDEPP